MRRLVFLSCVTTDDSTSLSHNKEDPHVNIDFVPFHDESQSMWVYSDVYNENKEAMEMLGRDRAFFAPRPLPS